MPARPRKTASVPGLPLPSGGKTWPATLWDVIRKARESPGADAGAAREFLLTRYYVPVYRFFQRAIRVGADRVEDVTQDFFTRFIEKDFLKNIHEEKSFRNFLKVACRRHYINWCDAERVRRGGRHKVVSMGELDPADADVPMPEDRFASLMDEELRAAFLAEALASVRARLSSEGKQETLAIFEARVKFDGDRPLEYEELAAKFGLRVYDVRNRLTAARKLFREALLEAARQRSDDAKEELREMDLLKYVE